MLAAEARTFGRTEAKIGDNTTVASANNVTVGATVTLPTVSVAPFTTP